MGRRPALKPKIVSKLLPITRTIRRLRAAWFVADGAETRRGQLSFDWGGFVDVIAWRADFGYLLVQCTGNQGHVASRTLKIQAEPRARAMIYAGAVVEVWGWRRDKEEPRIVRIGVEHMMLCPVIAMDRLRGRM